LRTGLGVCQVIGNISIR